MQKLTVCCDGTWNDEADRTHIFRISEAAKRLRDASVKPFYDEGVGTHFFKLSGAAVGKKLSKNIQQAYGWLVHNWKPGDQIFAFGFSRGAYTVRSLSGFLHFAGLLRAEDTGSLDKEGSNEQIDDAYMAYRLRDKKENKVREFLSSDGYQRTRHPHIHFLGVFDTVGALGIPFHFQAILNEVPFFDVRFHDTELCKEVETACHALAIDERRGPFEPTLWTGQPGAHQTVKQVWFAGVHSDIGGGYKNKALAEVPLSWMLNEAKAVGLDLWSGFAEDPLAPDEAGEINDSMTIKYMLLHSLSPSIDVYDRPIGPLQRPAAHPPVPGEMLHWSVKDRIEGSASRKLRQPYAPKSLVKDGQFRALWL